MNEAQEGRQIGGGLLDTTPSIVAAAHELKSPLALIRQLSFTIQNDPEHAAQNIDRIVLTAERALRLTSDITRQARLEDSFFVTEPLNAQMLLEEIAEEIMPLYRAHGRVISVVPHRTSPLVIANYDLLRRVLLGFSDNALQYADDQTPVELSLRTHPSHRTVRLQVRDFGPAIAKNSLQQAGDLLGTRPVLASRRPSSSGLGLFLARQFATSMRATIGIVRHRDGASFYIDVPASTQLSLL